MKVKIKDRLKRPGIRRGLIAAGLCFLLALFFRFALVGYAITALMFAFFGAVVLLCLFLPRQGKIVLTAALLIGMGLFIAAEIPVVRAARGEPEIDADYIIVLGAGVNGSVPSLSMVNRLTAAKAYLDAHPDCIAVLSGGKGEGEAVTEAAAMAQWLTAMGISEERLILEGQATNTAENLAYSLALLPPGAAHETLGVVSSEYHLYRAEYIARSLGFEVHGIPAETTLPLLKLNYFIREALGVVYYTIFGP